MLVTSRGRQYSRGCEVLVSRLGRVLAGVFAEAGSPVVSGMVRSAAEQARQAGADGVVSFGGGSCVEVAKAVCFLAEQQAGTPGVSWLDRPLLPHVAVTTTFSGSAFTPSFALTDEATGRTTSASAPTCLPVCVLCDPLLLSDLPVGLAVQSGMGALGHGVESACSPRGDPECEALAVACVSRAVPALVATANGAAGTEMLGELLAAAVLGGRAFGVVGAGLLHGLSQLLCGRAAIGYGVASSVLLPHFLKLMERAEPGGAAGAAAALGDPADAPRACERLRERLGLPARLSECGVGRGDIEAVARMAPGSSAAAAGGGAASEADALVILEAAF
jgi:maleylacetate reductase